MLSFLFTAMVAFAASPQILSAEPLDCAAGSICISPQDADAIAHKIWHNECAGTLKGLTSWNEGEDFASLGIGHFIWYPKNKLGPFREMFPDLLAFLSSREVLLPAWLQNDRTCPWTTRAAFQNDQESIQMIELRTLLANTIALQAEFMARRLQKSLPAMVKHFPDEKRGLILRHFNSLVNDPMGLYAVLDYLNFKGEGLLPNESYRGAGWGVIQVLEAMQDPKDGERAVVSFAAAANVVLERRVANSPPERNESRWLPGWQNRIKTYIK